MKKKYIQPQTEEAFAVVQNMLAESLLISDDTVNGSDALTKENNWDIWSDDAEYLSAKHPAIIPLARLEVTLDPARGFCFAA